MLDPDVAAAYDIVAGRYDEFYGSKPIFIAENIALMMMLKGGGFLDGPLLDLGCRTGHLLDICRNLVKDDDYLGVDFSHKMVALARRKHPRFHFVVGTSNRVPEGFFANTVSLFGLSYAPVMLNAMRSLWRSLRPDGRYFILMYGKGRASRGDYLLSDAGLRPPPEGIGQEGLHSLLDTVGLDSEIYGFVSTETAARLENNPDVERAAIELVHETLSRNYNDEKSSYLIAIGSRRHGGRDEPETGNGD